MTTPRFTKRLFLPAFLFLIFTATNFQANAQVDDRLIGQWSGIVNQPDFGSYETIMTIENLTMDETSGMTEYLTLSCTGSNIFLGAMDSIHHFSETIITVGSTCLDGRVEVYLLSPDSIQWNWYFDNGTDIIAFGKLGRQDQTNTSTLVEEAPLFELSEIHPNPVVHLAQFTLELKQTEEVAISLLDLNKREVLSIARDKLFAQQSYSFSIDPEHLPKGLYILSISSASFNTSKKVLVLK